VLAVAGVPGGTFSAVFGPMMVPRRLRPGIAKVAARAMAHVGPAVRVAAGVLAPQGGAWQEWSGPASYASASAHALRAFARHDWRWYAQLVQAIEEHAVMDLSQLRCPATFVGGRYDLITAEADVRAAAARAPGSRYAELPGSHYLPLEFPGALQRELAALAERVTWD
jgi:3-oxoadipate enol-lactonase